MCTQHTHTHTPKRKQTLNYTQEDTHTEAYARMQTFRHTHMHMQTHGYTHTHSGWQAQQCPLQAAISMEIVLIVPTDHTCGAQQARGESGRLSKSRETRPYTSSLSRP